MATLHKEYHTIEIDGVKHEIKFSVSFNKDRHNWATSEPKKIGYQVTVLPVKRKMGDGYFIEESGAFTGFNDNLLEVDRQSTKRLQSAIQLLSLRKDKYLNYFK